MIKVKGNQVAPAELEALLLEHEAVADAAVIGVTIDGDEHPRAYIVRAAGKSATEKDIQDFVKKQTTRTKWLTGGVRFVDAIPKNPVSESFHFKSSNSRLLTLRNSLGRYYAKPYEIKRKKSKRGQDCKKRAGKWARYRILAISLEYLELFL